MEHIPAIHAAKVGMRYPALARAVARNCLFLELDLTGVAPGRSPRLTAGLMFRLTLHPDVAKSLPLAERCEVVLFAADRGSGELLASLPADSAWLTWDGGTVRQLARRIRDTGDTSLLPILADALDEAGCNDSTTLARCRAPEDDDLRWLVTLLATQE